MQYKHSDLIETYESLCIMNSVMLILNLLLDNLKFTFTDLANQIRSPSSMNELVTVLNMSEAIFNNFKNSNIVRPFLAYFEHVSKFSHNKWLVFQYLCKQSYENDNLNE